MVKLDKIIHGKGLSNAETTVNDYVLSHIDAISSMTVRELAEASYTTPTTIMRYCKKIGYSGFEEFKIKIHQDLNRYNFGNYQIGKNEKSVQVLNKIRMMNEEVINKTMEMISIPQFETIARKIKVASIIDIIAYDANAALADYASHYFFQVGKICNVYEDVNQQLMLAMYAKPQEHLIFILTRGGLSPRAIKACQQLKSNHQYSVAITGRSGNNLDTYCSEVLYALFKDSFKEMGDLAFFTSAKFILDCLINIYYTQNYEEVLEKEGRYSSFYNDRNF